MSRLKLFLCLLLASICHVVAWKASGPPQLMSSVPGPKASSDETPTPNYTSSAQRIAEPTMDSTTPQTQFKTTTESTTGNISNLMILPTVSERKRNPYQGVMSLEQKDQLSVVISTSLLPILLIFGLVGNAFSIYVLVVEKLMLMKYLLALSVSDTLFLITGLLYWITKAVGVTNPVLQYSMQAVMFPHISVYVNAVAGSLSAQYTFLLTAERFVAVFAPLKARSGPLTRRAGTIILISGFFTFIYMVPQLLKYRTIFKLDRIYKQMRYMTVQTEMMKKNKGLFQGFAMSYILIYTVIFPVFIFVLSVAIVCLLRKAMREKSKMTSVTDSAVKTNRDATRIVLAIATSFLICYVPASVAYFVNLAYPDFGNGRREHYLYQAFLQIRYFLAVVNSSLNFCFYIKFNSKFRGRMMSLFVCKSRYKAASPKGDNNSNSQITAPSTLTGGLCNI